MRTNKSPTLPAEFGSERYRTMLQDLVRDHAQSLYKLAEDAIIVAVGDETTAITTGTGKVTFPFPFAFGLSELRIDLTTAQASGSIFTVDVNVDGATCLSTKLTIDNTETTSRTAATPAVISSGLINAGSRVSVDVDQIGASGAAGLKVTFIGVRQ